MQTIPEQTIQEIREKADIVELIDCKPEGVELVITGRGADPRIIEKADLVTEMQEIKHYFKAGVPARKGVEK